MAIVFVILLITYRSLQPAILFLLCGVGAVGIAQGVVYLLATYGDLTVNGQSAGILSVLVLGAGVDYALLIVARYREELHNYEDRHEAMPHALHHAAPAVLASGATVIIGLLCPMFAQMNSTSSLGPVGAAGIACALLVMLVTLPALLVIVGRWIFWPFVPRFGDPIKSDAGVWARVGQRITKGPRAVWVVTTLVLVGLSFGIVQLDADGLTNEQSFTTEQPSVVAEKKLAEHFPSGAGSPVAVIARGDQAEAVKDAFSGVDGFEGADSSFPLFAFVFLVALSIDYNIFLMSRVREESLEHRTHQGALIGLAATGGVITSAGFVLAGTLTALATLPLVFLVRSVLVTALNLDVGRHFWWPSRLGRTDGPGQLADDTHPAEPIEAAGEPAHRA